MDKLSMQEKLQAKLKEKLKPKKDRVYTILEIRMFWNTLQQLISYGGWSRQIRGRLLLNVEKLQMCAKMMAEQEKEISKIKDPKIKKTEMEIFNKCEFEIPEMCIIKLKDNNGVPESIPPALFQNLKDVVFNL